MDLPKATPTHYRVLTPDEARSFLKHAPDCRLGAVFSVALATGLRLREVLGLRWEDTDLDGKTLRVRQTLQRYGGKVHFGEPKSKQSRRTLTVPDFAVAALRKHRVRQKEERLKAGSKWQESGLVFTSAIGTPADERNVRRDFKTILEAAKLGHLKIHELRHTCASLLLTQAVHPKIVQETLGHSQISLTLDTYSHLIPGLQQEAARAIDALLTAESEEPPVGVTVGVNQPDSHPQAVANRQIS